MGPASLSANRPANQPAMAWHADRQPGMQKDNQPASLEGEDRQAGRHWPDTHPALQPASQHQKKNKKKQKKQKTKKTKNRSFELEPWLADWFPGHGWLVG